MLTYFCCPSPARGNRKNYACFPILVRQISRNSQGIMLPPRKVAEAAGAMPPLDSGNVAESSRRRPPSFITENGSASLFPVVAAEAIQGNNHSVIGEERLLLLYVSQQ